MNATRRALDEIETRRKNLRLSTRRAAERSRMSEASWRQLIAGSVRQGGRVVERVARPDQVLTMAAAVGALDDVAEIIDATDDQVAEARANVTILDAAEEEIMNSRHLSPTEKLILLESLNRSRDAAGQ